MKQYLTPFLVGVGIVAIMLAMFIIGDGRGYQRGYDEALALPHKADTVWKRDTHYVDKPVEVVKWKDREKPVYIAVTDTMVVSVHDTTFIAVEREIKGYSGEDYQAQVSGVQPQLDWIKVFPKTAYITNTVVEQRKWSIGVSGGAGVFWDGKEIKPGAGIIIGVQRRF